MRFYLILGFISLLILTSAPSIEAKTVKSFDGFPLTVFVDLPKSKKASEFFVIAHGSGPMDADGNLSAMTLPAGTTNLLYKEMAQVLASLGYGVLRYHKRAYEVRLKIQSDTTYTNSMEFKSFEKKPLSTFVKDFRFMAEYARKNLEAKKVYALGHSEGTQVALFAHASGLAIDGLVLIGLHNERQSALVLEQTTTRTVRVFFDTLDTNQDGRIQKSEYSAPNQLAQTLRAQVSRLDLNKDLMISKDEYLAGNYSNLINQPITSVEYQRDELNFPPAARVIEATTTPISVLVPTNDNQTPAYQVMAMDFLNRNVWKKKNLQFIYLKGYGHGLDRRSYDQLLFNKFDSRTFKSSIQKIPFLNY